jgi:hypothetical protein
MVEVKDSPFEPDFKITLGGRELILSFPMPAVWAFEDITGIDLSAGISKEVLMGGTLREQITRMIALCWAGLVVKQPEITREQVASWIYVHNVESVGVQVVQALAAAFPKIEKRKVKPRRPPLYRQRPSQPPRYLGDRSP